MLWLHECMREIDHAFGNFSLRHIASKETELRQRSASEAALQLKIH